jgi:hypothetical protein
MKHTASQVLPKARDKGLLVRELNDELLVYDLDRHKAHCLNKTAAIIWNQCDGQKTVDQIAGSLSEAFSSPVGEEVVWLGLKSLTKGHLLETGTAQGWAAHGLTRRELIRKAGLAAAVGLPLVTSIVAPRATEAATCIQPNQPCTANSECCSGNCVGAPAGACA